MIMVKVLYAASEAAPFVKTGGLADVMGALPRCVKGKKVSTALVIPKYGSIPPAFKAQMQRVYEGTVDLAWRVKYLGVDKLEWEGLTVYFIDNEEYFKRDRLYGYDDDAERFAFFDKAVLAMLPHIDFKPDIIHCNDWHTGMISVYLKECFYHDDFYQNIHTVYTIHNLKYQGIFPSCITGDLLGLSEELFTQGKIEQDGCVNFMKSGIVYADYLTTVSPSYAQEIKEPYFGEGLDGLVRSRQDKLQGVLNGLDDRVFDPATDKMLTARYDADGVFAGKAANKEALQARLGLPVDRYLPMAAMVSRLVPDKGLDLLVRIMDELVLNGIQLVILGTGEQRYEQALKGLAARNPTRVSINTVFDEELAHNIYAAADLYLMPSRFEACGLSQLIALKYGAVPVVREVGGLKDTITPFNKYTGEGNGISFANFNAHEFLFAIKDGLAYYAVNAMWSKLVLNAMHSKFGWEKAAQAYTGIYEQLTAAESTEFTEPTATVATAATAEAPQEAEKPAAAKPAAGKTRNKAAAHETNSIKAPKRKHKKAKAKKSGNTKSAGTKQ